MKSNQDTSSFHPQKTLPDQRLKLSIWQSKPQIQLSLSEINNHFSFILKIQVSIIRMYNPIPPNKIIRIDTHFFIFLCF